MIKVVAGVIHGVQMHRVWFEIQDSQSLVCLRVFCSCTIRAETYVFTKVFVVKTCKNICFCHSNWNSKTICARIG